MQPRRAPSSRAGITFLLGVLSTLFLQSLLSPSPAVSPTAPSLGKAASCLNAVRAPPPVGDVRSEALCKAASAPPTFSPYTHPELAAQLAAIAREGRGVGPDVPAAWQLQLQLTKEERERFSFEQHQRVYYHGAEVPLALAAEEAAVMLAAPPGVPLHRLNGANIGRGGRGVNEFLVGTDAHRGEWALGYSRDGFSKSTMLSLLELQPFRSGSLDYIVALHTLEHVADPIAVVLHWLDLLRPGGGLGVIVPDWRFTWDAATSTDVWGHKWNSEPSLVCDLWSKHWSGVATLEYLNSKESSRWAQNVEFVLRKHGTFVPIEDTYTSSVEPGRAYFCRGAFIGTPGPGALQPGFCDPV